MATPAAHTILASAGAVAHVLGAGTAFDAVFGVFVVAFLVLAVVTVRWAVKRDRAGRAEWARRQAPMHDLSTRAPPPRMNGHAPRQKGPKRGRGGPSPRGGPPAR